MDIFGFFTWIVLFLLLGIAYWYLTIPSNLPPGPKGLPIVGALPFLGRKPYLTFINFAKRYGNIIHFYMGSKSVVVLNDFDSIKEAFVKQAEIFTGRVEDEYFKGTKLQSRGVVMADGDYWRFHRRLIISNLRSNGVGKNDIEPQLMNEIQHFISELRKHTGKPYEIKQLLSFSLANNILALLTGARYEYDNDFMNKLVAISNVIVGEAQAVNLTMFFPWMKHVPFIDQILSMDVRKMEIRKIDSTIQQVIDNGQFPEEDDDATYVQAHMTERRKKNAQNSEEEKFFSDKTLLDICKDLFIAGSETSATTLLWAMLYLTHHPEVQVKIHKEIDSMIGRDREVSYNDRVRTPYTEAIIAEVHRMISLVPLSVIHRNIRDTVLSDFKIPKNTVIFPNIYAVHHDAKLWGDPETFRPERFINQEGKLSIPEYLIPFSIGKRSCAGEPLARMELYLYLVSIMQNFKLVPAKGIEQSLEATNAIVRLPKCITVCMEAR